MSLSRKIVAAMVGALALAGAIAPAQAQAPKPVEIMNVSYDIGRELFIKINEAFIPMWKAKTGQEVKISQSHNGTGAQARAILEGLPADVVTFNQVIDVQVLADKGKLIPQDWQKRLPNSSSPYYSLPAFLVRKGNPKNVKDWDDLARNDVKSVFPNPKTSGNARYTYLAAYAYGLSKFNGDHAKTQDFMKKFLSNVPVFDTGGRASTTTFVDRNIGDVLITFEAEVNAAKKEYGDKGFEIVIPSQSLLAEFPVALIDKNVDRKGTRAVASAYLDFLYTEQAQEIIAGFANRVQNPKVLEKHKADYPPVKLVTVEDVFGGWAKANKDHFSEGGILDKVLVRR
jgi:sulfate transport system substrate-binding protein